MGHRSHASFSTALKHQAEKPLRDEAMAAFGATAYGLQEGHTHKPTNPHANGKSEVAMLPEEHALYGAWRFGQQEAERYWQDWSLLPPELKEEFERAAHDHLLKVVQPEREAQRTQATQATQAAAPQYTAQGGEKVAGYQPVTDGKLERVNAFKAAEERVLRMLDALLTEYQNEAGDIAKEQADFQTTGYKRMSVEAQKEKIVEFTQRMATVQTALRWLAVGKTDLEKGFMAVNRSIFRPQRVSLPEDEQDE